MAFNFSVITVAPVDRPSPGLTVVAADFTRRESSRGNLRYRALFDLAPPLELFSSAS